MLARIPPEALRLVWRQPVHIATAARADSSTGGRKPASNCYLKGWEHPFVAQGKGLSHPSPTTMEVQLNCRHHPPFSLRSLAAAQSAALDSLVSSGCWPPC